MPSVTELPPRRSPAGKGVDPGEAAVFVNDPQKVVRELSASLGALGGELDT